MEEVGSFWHGRKNAAQCSDWILIGIITNPHPPLLELTPPPVEKRAVGSDTSGRATAGTQADNAASNQQNRQQDQAQFSQHAYSDAGLVTAEPTDGARVAGWYLTKRHEARTASSVMAMALITHHWQVSWSVTNSR
jgi:hypothetical protein